MLRKLVATLAAAALSFGAVAADVALVDSDAGPNASFDYTRTVGNGSFTDTLSFTLPAPSSWEASGSVNGNYIGLNFFGLLLGQGLTSLSVDIFGHTYSGTLAGVGFPVGTLTVSIPDQIVAAGNYSAVIHGVAQDSFLISGRPSYQFSLVAIPVPEPETYALFLAGLGLMGLVVRRRTRILSR